MPQTGPRGREQSRPQNEPAAVRDHAERPRGASREGLAEVGERVSRELPPRPGLQEPPEELGLGLLS